MVKNVVNLTLSEETHQQVGQLQKQISAFGSTLKILNVLRDNDISIKSTIQALGDYPFNNGKVFNFFETDGDFFILYEAMEIVDDEEVKVVCVCKWQLAFKDNAKKGPNRFLKGYRGGEQVDDVHVAPIFNFYLNKLRDVFAIEKYALNYPKRTAELMGMAWTSAFTAMTKYKKADLEAQGLTATKGKRKATSPSAGGGGASSSACGSSDVMDAIVNQPKTKKRKEERDDDEEEDDDDGEEEEDDDEKRIQELEDRILELEGELVSYEEAREVVGVDYAYEFLQVLNQSSGLVKNFKNVYNAWKKQAVSAGASTPAKAT